MFRKISIGPDYKNAMHYTVGQRFGGITIHHISVVSTTHQIIYAENDKGEISIWKEFYNVPVVVEKDIDAFG